MKQLYFILALLSITILSTSCGNGKQEAEGSDSTKTGTTTSVSAPPSGNRVFQLGKVKGYRIQVHTTLDREEALKYKTLFQKNFPDVPNYLVYEDPVYKVRIGDYLSKGEAKDFAVFVNKVKDLYGSFVVKCMVNAIIPPYNKDTAISITTADSMKGNVTWVDSSGKTVSVGTIGAPTEVEVLTKEDAAAERKMQAEDKKEEKAIPKEKILPKEEKVEKVEIPKVEKNIKPKSTPPKDSVMKRKPPTSSTVR